MPTTLLDRLLVLQAGHCFFCEKPLNREVASVEHLVPLARKGADKEHNTVACCKALNSVFGSIELKAKFETILKYKGKFVCPADVSNRNGQAEAITLARAPASTKPTATPLTPPPVKHGKLWTTEEDERLAKAFDTGMSVLQLAKDHKRGPGGVHSRLKKLGKIQAGERIDYSKGRE